MAFPEKLPEIERKLGSPLADLVAERRSASVSWRRIAQEVLARTGVDVTGETIRVWFADRIEVKVTVR